jgi:hypothetical protein
VKRFSPNKLNEVDGKSLKYDCSFAATTTVSTTIASTNTAQAILLG